MNFQNAIFGRKEKLSFKGRIPTDHSLRRRKKEAVKTSFLRGKKN